jgi:hypothetical protein
LAIQTSRWARFAAVEVEVTPGSEDRVIFADDTVDAATRSEVRMGAAHALHMLPGTNVITILDIRTSSVDTAPGDVFEATARAVWNALDMPHHDVSLIDARLIGRRFAHLHGRTVLAVTESRHWFAGKRGGDAESLVCPWLHFESAPPIQLRVHGEDLILTYDVPYPSCDMDEYGELRVGPATAPDLLATLVGERLTSSVAVATPWTSNGHVGGIILEFPTDHVLIGATGDEWVLVNDPTSEYLAAHWPNLSGSSV